MVMTDGEEVKCEDERWDDGDGGVIMVMGTRKMVMMAVMVMLNM